MVSLASLLIGSSHSLRLDNRSRMSREVHVRFWESARVRFLRATQLKDRSKFKKFGFLGKKSQSQILTQGNSY